MLNNQEPSLDPRCVKCGKRRSDHNFFGEFGYLCHNGSNTFLAETPKASKQAERPLPEEVALDIERDIRISIWNAGKWQGKPDEVAQSLIRKAMAEPPMVRALALIAALLAEPRPQEETA
jgi:hypothetical protein